MKSKKEWSKKKEVRRAFAIVRAHMRTPEGRTATRIANFIRAIARNQEEPTTELLEDIASRIDEGQGWT